MTSTYIATIRHHSIGSAPEIRIEGTLPQAKRAAGARFGDGFGEHEIAIYEGRPGFARADIVASRRVDAKRWVSHA